MYVYLYLYIYIHIFIHILAYIFIYLFCCFEVWFSPYMYIYGENIYIYIYIYILFLFIYYVRRTPDFLGLIWSIQFKMAGREQGNSAIPSISFIYIYIYISIYIVIETGSVCVPQNMSVINLHWSKFPGSYHGQFKCFREATTDLELSARGRLGR